MSEHCSRFTTAKVRRLIKLYTKFLCIRTKNVFYAQYFTFYTHKILCRHDSILVFLPTRHSPHQPSTRVPKIRKILATTQFSFFCQRGILHTDQADGSLKSGKFSPRLKSRFFANAAFSTPTKQTGAKICYTFFQEKIVAFFLTKLNKNPLSLT